jgi:lipopolysaccharide cholinephosphotransferase
MPSLVGAQPAGQNEERLVPGSSLKALQSKEIAMLAAFARICESHRLRYFLIGGSALGAVRHGGMIPWDDDIDVGMPRADYEKFVAVAPRELPENLFLQTSRSDSAYPLGFAKIRDSSTTFIESKLAHLQINHGIFIDIFPLDGCPGPKVARLYKAAISLLNAAIFRRFHIDVGQSKKTIKGLVFDMLAGIASRIAPVAVLQAMLDRIARSRDYDRSDLVINWFGAYGLREAVPSGFFGAGTLVAFDGLSVTIPGRPDDFLRAIYGDYMKLPPVEKRVSHHGTDAFDAFSAYYIHRVPPSESGGNNN